MVPATVGGGGKSYIRKIWGCPQGGENFGESSVIFKILVQLLLQCSSLLPGKPATSLIANKAAKLALLHASAGLLVPLCTALCCRCCHYCYHWHWATIQVAATTTTAAASALRRYCMLLNVATPAEQRHLIDCTAAANPSGPLPSADHLPLAVTAAARPPAR